MSGTGARGNDSAGTTGPTAPRSSSADAPPQAPRTTDGASGLPRSKAAIGEALAAGRSRAGLSYRELARRSHVPAATLQGWIGGRSLPTPALRSAFYDILDVLGLATEHTHEQWWDAVEQARRVPGKIAGNPYVGLRPYAPEDRDVFFGREEELAELVQRVRDAADPEGPRRVVTLIAPSGGGKSSLLGAGLIGTACAAGGALEGWYTALLTPGDNPEQRWRIGAAARREYPERPAVVVIDQFEELWTVAAPEQRRAALSQLESFIGGPGEKAAEAPTVLVVGLRSDFFGPAAEVDALSASLGRAMLLRTVTAEQAERIITEPARLRGVSVDPGLVAVLQRDLSIGGRPWAGGALPLLSQAMTETWDNASGTILTAVDYLAVGGVAGAIDRTAERAYADLDQAEQGTARQLLPRLVRVDLDTPVRRPLELALLRDEDWDVVERFARARLLTVGEDTVELAHEALLQHWTRLRGWVEEDLVDLLAQASLARAAALWDEHARDPDMLVPVERFGLGLEVDDASDQMLGSTDREFVAASRTHFAAREQEQLSTTKRLRRRSRVAILAFAVATVLAILAGVAMIAMQNTRNQALSRQVALTSSLVAAQDPGLAAQVALGASELSRTPEGTSALISASGRSQPRRALGPAGATKLATDTEASLLAQPEPDGSVRLWRAEAAQGATDATPEVVALDPDRKALFAGAVTSVDGRRLVAAGGMGGAWLVDATTQPARVLASLGAGAGTTYALAFSPDGRTLYAGTQDGSIRRWDVTAPDTPRESPALPTQADPVLALAFNTTGTRLAAAGAKGVSRWALDGGAATALPLVVTSSAAQAVAFSPDGRWLVAGESRSRQVSRWIMDGDTAVAQSPLGGFASWINDVHFSPDGTRVLAASSDQTMREFAHPSGGQVRSYPHPAVVSAAIYARDHVASAATDGTVRWWPRTDPEIGHFGLLYQVSADAAGDRLLATVDRTGSIAAWDLADPAQPRRLPQPARPAGEASGSASVVTAVLGDGSAVLGGSKVGDLLVWNRRGDTFAPPQVIPVDPGQDITWIGSSADGRTVLVNAMASQKSFVLRRTGETFAVTGTMDVNQPQSMALSADGHVAVLADIDGGAGVWAIDDEGHVTRPTPLPDLGSIGTAAVLHPDGKSVAIGTDVGRVVVYDLTKPAEPRLVISERTALGAIYGLSVSPDGRFLAAGAGDKRIWVWEWTSQKLTPWSWIEAALDRVNDVRFIDNGGRLVGVGANGTIASWDTDLTRVRRTVCEGRGSPLTTEEWGERLVGVRPRNLC